MKHGNSYAFSLIIRPVRSFLYRQDIERFSQILIKLCVEAAWQQILHDVGLISDTEHTWVISLACACMNVHSNINAVMDVCVNVCRCVCEHGVV